MLRATNSCLLCNQLRRQYKNGTNKLQDNPTRDFRVGAFRNEPKVKDTDFLYESECMANIFSVLDVKIDQ